MSEKKVTNKKKNWKINKISQNVKTNNFEVILLAIECFPYLKSCYTL